MALKRSILLEGTTQPPLVLSTVTRVNVPRRCLHLEEKTDGTFLLCFTSSLIPEMRELQAMRVGSAEGPAKKPTRSLTLEGTTQAPSVISKFTQMVAPKKCLYLDEVKDGTFVLVVSSSLLPDVNELQALRVLREEVFAEEQPTKVF